MKKTFTNALEFLARLIPLWLYPALMPRDWIDFFYHAVSDRPMEHVRHLYPVVPVAKFEDALRYLQEKYTLVSYAQLHAQRLGEPDQARAFPVDAAHLSFDDGFQACFSVVRPLLLRQEIPATFFLVTDWINNQAMFARNKVSLCLEYLQEQPQDVARLDRFMSPSGNISAIEWLHDLTPADSALVDQVCATLGVDWQIFLEQRQPYLTSEQIRQMCAEGFTFGAHTRSHRKLMDLSPAEIETEIVASCRRVQEITGQDVVPFSFPHSAFGVSRQLLADIRQRHSFVGLLFDTKGVRKDADFIVNRVWAERPLTPARELHPLPEVLHHAYQEAWVDRVMDALRNLKPSSGHLRSLLRPPRIP
jgi:peptidoglycan/xylan/chitin deacetylase (PgdA/CDA1 family)